MEKKPTYEELEQKVRELERNSSRDGQSKNKPEMESVFKETINASVDAMVIADEDAKVLLWNPSAERIFGYKEKEMIGRHFHDLVIPKENRERVVKKFGKAVRTGTLSDYGRLIPTEGLRKDGSRFPLEHTVSMFETNGKLRFVAILRDATAQERTAAELTQLIDTANAPIFGVDVDGKINEWNQMAARITGYDKDEVEGKNLVKGYIREEYRASVTEVLNNALKGEETANYEVPLFTKDGTRIMVLLNATTRRDVGGNIVGVVGVGQDITDIDAFRAEMERTAAELTQLIDTANAPIFGVDVDGKINEWNQMAARITGYDKDEVEGKNLVKVYIREEYRTSVKEVLDNALKGEETANYEVPLFTKDGTRIMVLLNATTRRDVGGNIVGVVGVGQDITELNEHRENVERLVEIRTSELNAALKDTERARDKVDGILKSVADGLIVTDPYNRVVSLNQAAEDLLGIRLTEVIDRPIDFAIKEKGLRDRVKETLDKKTTGYQFDFEQPGDDPEHPKIMRARTSVIHDYEDKETGIVTIIHDVTYEREVDRMKTDFLSIAAHELRTPMTSVLGYSELLLIKDNLSEENKNEFIKYIHEESVAVTKLINDLLDISRIESGKEPPLNKEWCIVGDAIRQIAPYFVESSPKHRLEIILPKEEHKLFVDKEKIAQVIKNIIDNAVKYSPDGGVIRITGKLMGDNYRVSIQDQGIGMTSEEAEKIFDRFFRTATSLASGIRGLGLGMSITKHIVELHKGMISAESEPGKGTTVSFTIPVGTDENLAYQI